MFEEIGKEELDCWLISRIASLQQQYSHCPDFSLLIILNSFYFFDLFCFSSAFCVPYLGVMDNIHGGISNKADARVAIVGSVVYFGRRYGSRP